MLCYRSGSTSRLALRRSTATGPTGTNFLMYSSGLLFIPFSDHELMTMI